MTAAEHEVWLSCWGSAAAQRRWALTGTVVTRNEALDGSPELVNSDPYGEGWMLEIQVEDAAAVEALLDAEAYVATIS